MTAGDPARTVGPQPTPAQYVLVEDYAAMLASRVLPTAVAEVRAVAAEAAARGGRAAHVSGRSKDASGLIDKVVRMTSGTENRPPRPHFRVGDIIDAVGTRITVPDMATLSAVLEQVKTHFGTGDGGRILEIENMYAEPKSKNPDYRVVTLTIAIEVDGKPYTFELQLSTERASVAADLEHNTIYKAYIPISQRQRRTVRSVMREAAALDQGETVTHE
jgi:ppGpp synthetase/RelA/SpoT-type nucleotidyltranferase